MTTRGEMAEIRITRRTCESMIEARCYGVWAVHPMVGSHDYPFCAVTHIPSGLAARDFLTGEEAVPLWEQLIDRAPAWGVHITAGASQNIGKAPRFVREAIAAVLGLGL